MKTKITINHDGFHGLTTRNIVVDGKPGDRVELTESQIKKLARAACGIDGCTCGESMLAACEVRDHPAIRAWIVIPEDGDEIDVDGNYPQG